MNSLRSLSSGSQTVVLTPDPLATPKPGALVFPQIEKKVDQLMDKLLNYEKFSEKELQNILAWRQEAAPLLKQNVPRKTTLALASLALDILRPALCEGKDQCLDFEDELAEILQPLLSQPVEAYFDEVEQEDLARLAMEEKFRRADLFHQEEMRAVCHKGNQKTQNILQTFGEMKAMLSDVNRERRNMAQEAHQQFDRLTKETEEVSQRLKEQALEADRLGGEWMEENEELRRLLEEGKTLKV